MNECELLVVIALRPQFLICCEVRLPRVVLASAETQGDNAVAKLAVEALVPLLYQAALSKPVGELPFECTEPWRLLESCAYS